MNPTLQAFINISMILAGLWIFCKCWDYYSRDQRAGCVGLIIVIWLFGWLFYVIYHFVSKYW